MSTYDYMARQAEKMLNRYGKPVDIERIETGDYDPATGQAESIVTTMTVKGAVFDFEQADIDGTLIQGSDRRIFLHPNADIAVGDTIKVDDDALVAIAIKPLKPGNKLIIYEVQARGQ